MKNFIQPGKTVSFLAGADLSSGAVVALGDQGMYGIVAADVANGDVGEADIEGVFEIPCAAGFTPDAFDPVYWDVADGEANADDTNPPIGYAIPYDATTAAAKEATGSVVLRVLLKQPPLAVGA